MTNPTILSAEDNPIPTQEAPEAVAEAAPEPAAIIEPPPAPAPLRLLRRLPFPAWWLGAAAAVIVLLVFPIGMMIAHNIDDDAEFGPAAVEATQSRAVAMAAALIHREIDVNKWTPNKPFFMPAGWLDNMPSYQTGIVSSLARFAAAIIDERGPGAGDLDLMRAAGLLKYPGTIWKFDPRSSWLPTASAEKQYRNAQRAFDLFNDHLSKGSTTFDRRPESLAALLDSMARDLDEAGDVTERHMAEGYPALLDFSSDDVFYANKGHAYAYSLLMRELAWDYNQVLTERRLGPTWTKLVDSLRAAAQPRPLMVVAAATDATVLPNHLLAQGFYLLRARALAGDLAAALRK
jgi:hypothetical protein